MSQPPILLDGDGMVIVERVVAVGKFESAPIKRLLQEIPDCKTIVLTGGQKRQTVLFLDSGHVVVTAKSLEEIQQALAEQ